MKTKQLKFRRPDGSAYYEEVVDHEGVIELAFFMLADDPERATPQLRDLCNWVIALGRMPTGKEFTSFLESRGVNLTPFEGTQEDFEN